MNILFIHQNMPAQFLHLCRFFRDRGDVIFYITKNSVNSINGVTKVVYKTSRESNQNTHHYLRTFEEAVLHGQAVFRSITGLLSRGFRPDIVIGHAGWGETLFVKDVLPDVPLLAYFEFYYNSKGQDTGFDAEFPVTQDALLSLRCRNAVSLLAYAGADRGLTPTNWQLSTHPLFLTEKISVIHEGIDTEAIRPDPGGRYRLKNGRVLVPGTKVITFIARNLEPYRGFHVFMRAIPEIQKRHPDAEIIIVGNDGVSYGSKLPGGDTYKARLCTEVEFDRSRVHFEGYVQGPAFHSVMNISAVHVYLTYPFVLSWSMIEAMACGCLVIGSDTSPVREVIVDRYNGLLVDFFNRPALVNLIDEALSHPDRFKQVRRAARNTAVAGYDLQSVCLPKQLSLIADMMRKP